MNPHFVEIRTAFRDENVEHLVIGAHALAAYGHVRATLAIDIWVKPTEENAGCAWRASIAATNAAASRCAEFG
jgi:hypothetical protein